MSEDYFADGSDAEFLALAQQLDTSRSNGIDNRKRKQTAGTTTVPSTASSTSTHKPSTPSRVTANAPSETSKASQTTPRILRPGFNAIIVNTRQVLSLLSLANFPER
jgi:hypothetical protein